MRDSAAAGARRSIAQGCSEYNITVLIDQKDAERALRAVHGRFYLATLPLAVGLVGPGLIGSTLLTQIHQQHAVRAHTLIVFSVAAAPSLSQPRVLQALLPLLPTDVIGDRLVDRSLPAARCPPRSTSSTGCAVLFLSVDVNEWRQQRQSVV